MYDTSDTIYLVYHAHHNQSYNIATEYTTYTLTPLSIKWMKKKTKIATKTGGHFTGAVLLRVNNLSRTNDKNKNY